MSRCHVYPNENKDHPGEYFHSLIKQHLRGTCQTRLGTATLRDLGAYRPIDMTEQFSRAIEATATF